MRHTDAGGQQRRIVEVARFSAALAGAMFVAVGASAAGPDAPHGCPEAPAPRYETAGEVPTRAELEAAFAALADHTQAATARIACLTEAIDSAVRAGKSVEPLTEALGEVDAAREAAWSAFDDLQTAWIEANAVRSGNGDVVRAPSPDPQ